VWELLSNADLLQQEMTIRVQQNIDAGLDSSETKV
jgi:hypothetical protein